MKSSIKNDINSSKKTSDSKPSRRRFALAVALTMPLFITSGASDNLHSLQCATQADNASCITKHSANNSWLRWFSGGSRSAQFQFIDLFELVHSPKDDSRKTGVPTREG